MIDDPIPRLKEQLKQSILAETGRMNQLAAAQMLGVDEARMSNLENGRLDRFSLQKLIRLLAKMNRRVDLTVVAAGPLPRRRFNQHLLASKGMEGHGRGRMSGGLEKPLAKTGFIREFRGRLHGSRFRPGCRGGLATSASRGSVSLTSPMSQALWARRAREFRQLLSLTSSRYIADSRTR